ncbi:MAG TPA: substrate-binding domain-containing protein [Steroidobacteraceae bacterium]|jgi:ABC-type phosphate transport system substrate-binding protein
MKKQLCFLAAAVAATLGASSAFALAPTGPFTVQLTVSGSSAFEAALESELGRVGSTICKNGTVAAPALTYNKFQSSTNDFRAYTCNLATGVVSAGGGETAVIYYRGEGGSVMGLRPLLASGPQIKRLQLSSCAFTTGVGSTVTNSCPTVGYVAVSDAVSSGLEDAVSQVGLADLEPAVFTGENYPTAATYSFLQPALNVTERNSLNGSAAPMVGQAFGVYVNTNNAELGNVDNLSRNTIANIFKGTYSDWQFVPKIGGGTVTSTTLPIKVCRREAGSGTQVATSIFFNATTGFVSTANPLGLDISAGGGGVQENGSTGGMRTCISGTPGAIGYISSEADDTGRRQIQIDGQGTLATETANNLGPLIATGEYDYWYEMVSIKRPGLTGSALSLANKLISVSQLQASGPTTPNIAFLSPTNAPQYPVVTVAGKQPVSCVRRNKDSNSIGFWQC